MNTRSKIFTKEFVIICFCLFAGGYVVYGLNSAVPLYVNSIGGTTSVSGMLNTSFTVCACVFRILGGHLCDRIGRKRIIIVGAVIFTLATAFYSNMTAFVPLMIFRGVQGMGYAIMSIGANTALVDVLPEDRYGEGLGYSSLANTLAGSTAPSVVIWMLTDFDFKTMFITTACVVLCGGIAAVLFCNYEKKPEFKAEQARALEEKRIAREQARETRTFAERTIWTLLEKQAFAPALVYTCCGIGTAIVYIYMTLYAVEVGIANPGLFFTASSVSMVFARIVGGRFADRENALPCVIVGYVLMIASIYSQVVTQNAMVYYISGVFFGISGGLIFPIMNRLAIMGVSADRRGAASATFSISSDISMCIGGMIWGLVIEAYGYVTGFTWVTIWLVFSFVLAVVYLVIEQRRRKRINA